MNQIQAKDLIIINSLPPKAVRGERVSIDSEFFGQEKKRLHRPHGQFAYLGCSFDGVSIYYITDEKQIQEFYNRIDEAVHVYVHAKYDLTQLRRFANLPARKKLWDCMLIEQIMFSGYYTDFGLADLARRYLGVFLSKEVRKSFSDKKDKESTSLKELGYDDTVSMSREQIEYSCIDVAATWRVYKEQRAIIDDGDLEIWKEIELPFLWTLLSMGGVKLDTEKWIALAEKNGKIAQDIQDKYGRVETIKLEPKTSRSKTSKEVFTGINLNSPAQVKKHFHSLGYVLASTGEEELEKIAEDCEFAREMLTYRTYSKRASTYGKSFVDDYVEADGKVYADIFQIGAETGRTSYRAPNLQNQPHEFEYRDCFIAEEDKCMIVADWGSQEPRIAAYLSQDQGLIDALNGSEKLYIAIARDVLGKTIKKESEEYKAIKSTVLGIFYGMSAFGLAKRIGCSKDEAQAMIDEFLEAYPGVADYMERQRSAKDFVTSIYGRKIWLNKYSFQWERNALNAPIQSSAADAMKIAAYRFMVEMDAIDIPSYLSPLKLLVHDEIVIECGKVANEKVKSTLEQVMIEVAEEMHDGIKGSVEIFPENGKFGASWGVKH